MNKTQIIGGIVGVIVIIGGLIVYTTQSTTPSAPISTESDNNDVATSTPQTSPVTTAVTPKSSAQASTNTFQSIFKQQGSHVCDYEQVGQDSKTSGVVYIADGKMRAEFRTTTATGNNPSSLMVYNGGTLYVWTEGTTVGTKSTLKSVSELPFIIPDDLSSGAVLGSGLDSVSWNCHAWLKNDALLVPPSSVKFQ